MGMSERSAFIRLPATQSGFRCLPFPLPHHRRCTRTWRRGIRRVLSRLFNVRIALVLVTLILVVFFKTSSTGGCTPRSPQTHGRLQVIIAEVPGRRTRGRFA